MRVSAIMTTTPAACSSKANLGTAIEMLWSRNCGMLPVVSDEGKVIGVVTDRDLCVALGTRNRLAGEISVGEIVSGKLFACKPDDDVRVALSTMGREKVRRLAVINKEGRLEGVLSMDDVVTHCEPRGFGKTPELSYEDVVDTLKKVYETQFPVVMRGKVAVA